MKRGRSEAPWTPDFSYECTEGHVVQADQPVSQCPAYRLGEPCTGALVRFGKGSRAAARATIDA